MHVAYAQEPRLTAEEFIALLRNTSLGERRPVDDVERIGRMIEHADIMLTARVDGRLVGIARTITDYSFATYLSDLAVDEAHQGRGIGRELIRRTQEIAGKQAMLVLIAAPQAETYYPHVGLEQHPSCWFLPRE